MAWTTEQLAAIEDAIAAGALEVKYADRSVKYQSRDELIATRNMIRAELGLSNRDSRRRFASFSKGLE